MQVFFPEDIFGPAPAPSSLFDEWLAGHGYRRLIFLPEEIQGFLNQNTKTYAAVVITDSVSHPGDFHVDLATVTPAGLFCNTNPDKVRGLELYEPIPGH